MKIKARLAGMLVFSLSSIASALNTTTDDVRHWAVQGVIGTGGSLAIGLANYAPSAEFGASISGSVNNAEDKTSLVTPVLFGGWRKSLTQNTYFALGLELGANFGEDSGQDIDLDYFVGPYLSLEQQLTPRLLLIGWILPYQYEYQQLDGVSTSTDRFFASGGIGFSYFM